MSYSENLANDVREKLLDFKAPKVKEIKMYGGLAFMVNGKMCICIGGSDPNNIMVRVGKEMYDNALKKKGAIPTVMRGKPIKGYIDLGSEAQKELDTWVEIALKFNADLTKL